ncbi:hypothetical protein [Vibrio salinus]|uniref:hypothetical protein n=1 Tax=Vibrio salinus TaxID=2899784 RepID=UPI001E36DF66|nr:hypothetical protein [Vibrio salinus]MCE0493807.1 hypothetical protein [Vibrio salinus]
MKKIKSLELNLLLISLKRKNYNKSYMYIFLSKYGLFSKKRIQKIALENGNDNKLNKIALINAISRNITVKRRTIEENLINCLNYEPTNIRWIISCLDSISDSRHFNINERLLSQSLSIYLSQLKLYLDYDVKKTKKVLPFGLTTYKLHGDIFKNQQQRIYNLSRECSKTFQTHTNIILSKINSLSISGFSNEH